MGQVNDANPSNTGPLKTELRIERGQRGGWYLWHKDHPFDSTDECCVVEVASLLRLVEADQKAIDTLLEALEKLRQQLFAHGLDLPTGVPE